MFTDPRIGKTKEAFAASQSIREVGVSIRREN